MYQALYRKWRPRVFEDVAGQPAVTATLRSEVASGRVAHAYLFTGSRGTGKTTCAKILAKAVNCLNPHDGDPCNECENCRGIDSGSLLDVVEIDAASNNGVDNIRDLRDETVYTPASAKFRVYIIDEAHMLSTGAFNALLKTLEEPPAYVVFILATTEAHKVPATVVSRCQRFDFHRIPVPDITARLRTVAQAEHIALTEGAADMIARVADGALRDALSLLDQCAGEGGEVDEARVAQAAGLADRGYLFELSNAVARGDFAAALAVVDRLYRASKDVERLCTELIGHFRDLMLIQSVEDPFSLIVCRADEQESLREAARALSPEAVLHAAEALAGTLDALRRGSSGRVLLESCLLRLCRPELDDTNAALLRRVKALESGASAPAAPGRSPYPNPPARQADSAPAAAEKELPESKPASAPESTGENGETAVSPGPRARGESAAAQPPQPRGLPSTDGSADTPVENWAEVLEALKKGDMPLYGVLRDSTAIVRGTFVLIDPHNNMFADLIRSADHRRPLVEAVRQVTGQPYKVGIFTHKPAPRADDPLEELAGNAARAGIDIRER